MIKTLSKSLREYKKTSIITILLSIVEVAFEILMPLCMSNLIDYGIGDGVIKNVVKYGVALLIFAIMQLLTGICSAKIGAKSAVGFAANLREDMYANVQTFSFANIDKFSTASIVTRLTTDVTNIQNSYQMLIRMAIRAPFMLIFAVVASFTINVKIALIYLAMVPVLGGLLFLIIYKVHPIFRRVFKTYDKLNNVVEENVRGIRVVKSFNQENFEIKKFEDISNNIYKDFSKAERITALNSPIMDFCIYLCLILVSWFGAKAIIASGNNPEIGLTTGALTALITYAFQILMSLMMLSMVFVMIVIANASAKRIAEVLQEKSDITSPQNAIRDVESGEIEFRNVDFCYSKTADKKVLDNISFYISSGETVGILGGTGSSKSSLVQLIPRLYDVTCGELHVGGKNVKDYDLEVLRNAVSMVLQKNVLFSGSIKDNLRWGKEDATDEEMIEACKLACADEFISTLPNGYDTFIEEGGANVSGGQKQRLCIARALLKKPKVLILDDSTSAVDTQTDAVIQKAFQDFIPNTTKIIIAQRISSVQNADKIIILDDGKIMAIGTHDELIETCPVYREVYLSQQKGG